MECSLGTGLTLHSNMLSYERRNGCSQETLRRMVGFVKKGALFSSFEQKSH